MPLTKNKHFVLYVDVNGTIIAADKARNKDDKAAQFELVAENIFAKWSTDVLEPISFKAYVDEYLVPGDKNNSELKRLRLDLYSSVIDTAKNLDSNLHMRSVELYQKIQTVQHQDQKVFDSFIAAVKYLEAQQVKFTIVLRTFGQDLATTLDEIRERVGLTFKHGKILGCQDNYNAWKNSGFSHLGGKPFPLDLDNNQEVSAFIDDNAKDKNIVCANLTNYQLPAHIEPTIFQTHLQNLLIETKLLIPAKTLEARLDNNYFINIINKMNEVDLAQVRDRIKYVEYLSAKESAQKTSAQQKSYATNSNLAFHVNAVPTVVSETTTKNEITPNKLSM